MAVYQGFGELLHWADDRARHTPMYLSNHNSLDPHHDLSNDALYRLFVLDLSG